MKNKLSLQEYANLNNISLVTINKRINKGLINSVKEGNRRYIIVDDEETEVTKNTIQNKPSLESSLLTVYKERIKDLQKVNKQYLKQLNKLNKRITELEKENKELNTESKTVYKQFINEIKLLAPAPTKKKKKKK